MGIESPRPNSRRLGHRLGRAFFLQAVVISVTAIVGVWAAALTIERVLIKQALEAEAKHYWQLRSLHPSMPPPNTLNLTGYVASGEGNEVFPSAVRYLTPGYHRLDTVSDMTVVHVSERQGERLVLQFDGEQVRELSVLFGLAPLGLLLVLLYFAAWFAYRAGRRAISPVEWLARQVRQLAPDRTDPDAFSLANMPMRADAEVIALAEALGRLNARVRDFADRERTFTRDASHELRSPLTVIRLATSTLLSRRLLDEDTKKTLLRIERAAKDMQGLTEALLLLARESELGSEAEPTNVNSVVRDVLDRAGTGLENRLVQLRYIEECELEVQASPEVVSILTGNLIGNAIKFTETGEVRLSVTPGVLEIRDTGIGMSPDQLEDAFRPFFRVHDMSKPIQSPGAGDQIPLPTGHGVGLTIVKRISERFGWPIAIESEPGHGTRVLIKFPEGRVVRSEGKTFTSSSQAWA